MVVWGGKEVSAYRGVGVGPEPEEMFSYSDGACRKDGNGLPRNLKFLSPNRRRLAEWGASEELEVPFAKQMRAAQVKGLSRELGVEVLNPDSEVKNRARARRRARARSVGFQRRKANPISRGNDLFHCSDGERKNVPSSSLHGRDFEHEHEDEDEEKPISQRPLVS
jgi:hypothetical protein